MRTANQYVGVGMLALSLVSPVRTHAASPWETDLYNQILALRQQPTPGDEILEFPGGMKTGVESLYAFFNSLPAIREVHEALYDPNDEPTLWFGITTANLQFPLWNLIDRSGSAINARMISVHPFADLPGMFGDLGPVNEAGWVIADVENPATGLRATLGGIVITLDSPPTGSAAAYVAFHTVLAESIVLCPEISERSRVTYTLIA